MILEFNIKDQLFCCLVCVIVGSLFGILYDVVRVIYILSGIDPHESKKRNVVSKLLILLFDLIYMLIVTVVFAVVLYALAFGKFRVIFGISCIVGFLIYNKTLSKIVINIIRKLASLLNSAAKWIFRIFLYPIKSIIKFLIVISLRVYSHTFEILIYKIKFCLDLLRFNIICKRKIDKLIVFCESADKGC